MAEEQKKANTRNGAEAVETAERHAANAANALDAKLSGPLAPVENALNDVFGDKASFQLPKDIKELLVKIAPWLALIGGILGLISAYNIWQWAHRVNRITEAFRVFDTVLPQQSVNLSLMFWVSIATTVLFAVLALLAFPGLQAKKKVGWNLMFYSLLANIAYSVATLFYDGGNSFLMTLVTSAVGLFILFQVRSHYKA